MGADWFFSVYKSNEQEENAATCLAVIAGSVSPHTHTYWYEQMTDSIPLWLTFLIYFDAVIVNRARESIISSVYWGYLKNLKGACTIKFFSAALLIFSSLFWLTLIPVHEHIPSTQLQRASTLSCCTVRVLCPFLLRNVLIPTANLRQFPQVTWKTFQIFFFFSVKFWNKTVNSILFCQTCHHTGLNGLDLSHN